MYWVSMPVTRKTYTLLRRTCSVTSVQGWSRAWKLFPGVNRETHGAVTTAAGRAA